MLSASLNKIFPSFLLCETSFICIARHDFQQLFREAMEKKKILISEVRFVFFSFSDVPSHVWFSRDSRRDTKEVLVPGTIVINKDDTHNTFNYFPSFLSYVFSFF